MHQASVGFHCPECTNKNPQKVYQGIDSMRVRPIVTQVLVAINVAVFLIGVVISGAGALGGEMDWMQTHFGLVAKLWERGGSLYTGPVPGSHEVGVGAGEWYRMVTSGFLHYGLLHIAFNMYALWILGAVVEQMGGRLRMGVVYGVSLMAGSFGALLLSPDSLTAGASGAIFGLMAAIIAAHRAQGIPFKNSPLLAILIINLVITFGMPGISIGGHIGGLIGGAIAGWALFDLPRRSEASIAMGYIICGAVTLICLVGGVAFSTAHMPPLF